MSHRCEASMKHDKKVCDFCPIITPLDYTIKLKLAIATFTNKSEKNFLQRLLFCFLTIRLAIIQLQTCL